MSDPKNDLSRNRGCDTTMTAGHAYPRLQDSALAYGQAQCSAMKHLNILVALLFASCASAETLPVIPWINQDNIESSICIRGFTKSIRPPVSVTNEIKHRKLDAAGTPFAAADTKLDHIIPLALAGAPDDERNLVLQRNDESHDKDRVEVCLARSVCAGRLTLSEAQRAIWENWRTAARLCSSYSVNPERTTDETGGVAEPSLFGRPTVQLPLRSH